MNHSRQCVSGKTSDLTCNESWRINTGNGENSGTQDAHRCIHALNRTMDLFTIVG